jgi:hypothetical protein
MITVLVAAGLGSAALVSAAVGSYRALTKDQRK